MTCQLILGSGAYSLGKLETIQPKHLALTAQCLSFILEELPFVKSQLFLHVGEL
jgi:hypothetical protein